MKYLLIFPLALSLSVASAETTIEWEGNDLSSRSSGIIWPDTDGSNDIRSPIGSGVSVGKGDAAAKADKILEFNGEQGQPARTSNTFPPVLEAIEIALTLRMDNSPTGGEQTVIRYGTQWEIRADAQRGRISFIVWHDKDLYTSVFVPVKVGEWTEVQASLKDSALQIKAGGQEEQVAMKNESVFPQPEPVALAIGATKNRPQDGSEYRPFAGAISALKISQ